jgi:VanZ family protein
MWLSSGTYLLEFWLPLLVWIGLTQLFSSDAFSYSESASFFAPLLAAIFPGWSMEQIELVHSVFRNIGHVFEFFVMGMLAYRVVRLSRNAVPTIAIAGVCVLLAGALDELHQMMTLYRGPSLLDVAYDFLGATLGIWLISVVDRRWTGSRVEANS